MKAIKLNIVEAIELVPIGEIEKPTPLTDDTGQPVVVPTVEKEKKFTHSDKLTKNQLKKRQQKAKRHLKKRNRRIARKKK